MFSAPFDVVFSNLDVVEPDLLFISAKRLETDETVKRKLYERFGVQEY